MKKSTLLKISRAMLTRAAELFSRNGCNDVNLAELVPDLAERRALALEIATWNGDPSEHNPRGKHELGLDWVLMKFAAAMLAEHVRSAETLEAVQRGEIFLSLAPGESERIGLEVGYRPTIAAPSSGPVIYAGPDETEPLIPTVTADATPDPMDSDPHAQHLLAEIERGIQPGDPGPATFGDLVFDDAEVKHTSDEVVEKLASDPDESDKCKVCGENAEHWNHKNMLGHPHEPSNG